MLAFFVAKTPPMLLLCAVCLSFCAFRADAQKRRPPLKIQPKTGIAKRAAPVAAIVIDERLAVLRFEPNLSAVVLQRMRTGREMQIVGERDHDGVRFYRVQMPPETIGWVQAEAVVSKNRAGDDQRLARFIRASEGFEQVERAQIFLENFPSSALRPAVLLLAGDLLEEHAARLTRDAVRRLDDGEMRANAAPVHSYFMNYNGLDRYRKIGANFVFDAANKRFRYDGAWWRELVRKHPGSAESKEAAKRLEALGELK